MVISIYRCSPEVLDVGDPLLQDGVVTSEFLDLEFEDADVLQPLVVLDLALVQRRLLDLDLLVQQGELIVTSHQLGTQDVSLTDHLQQHKDVHHLLNPWCVSYRRIALLHFRFGYSTITNLTSLVQHLQYARLKIPHSVHILTFIIDQVVLSNLNN